MMLVLFEGLDDTCTAISADFIVFSLKQQIFSSSLKTLIPMNKHVGAHRQITLPRSSSSGKSMPSLWHFGDNGF